MTGDGLAEMQALLGRVALFRDAGQADIKALAAMCDRRAHAAGEVAFLDGGERTADATALDDTTLLILSRADFLPFLARRPALAIGLLGVLCERLRNVERRLA